MNMKRMLPFIMLFAYLLSGCATTGGPAEHIKYSMPRDTQAKHVKEIPVKPGELYLTRFVWQGKSIDNWTEALDVINGLRKNYPATINDAYKGVVERDKERCTDVKVNVLSQDLYSILYEIKTMNCKRHPDEVALTRVLYGTRNVFILIYTSQTKEIPKDKRDEWIAILSDAKIETMK